MGAIAVKLKLATGTTLLDRDDYIQFKDLNWYIMTKGKHRYVIRYVGGGRLNTRRVLLHRAIMNAPKGMVVDHINGNGLDNRRCNLRICTQAQNTANRTGCTTRTTTSKFKGVYKIKNTNKWRAQSGRGKGKHIGCFDSEQQAALAYDKRAKENFGEYAKLNFKEGETS